MFTLLLIIYLSFVVLGLPDSLLGSAWPVMHTALAVPVSYAGIVSMIISCGTVVSSLMSARMLKRFGTGAMTAAGVGLMAASLLGISFSRLFFLLCAFAVPLGLGSGIIDVALNDFVALHYSARHMNWLHCFWGVGATAGPLIMSLCLARQNDWHLGYLTVGLIQCAMAVFLAFSVPLWRRPEAMENAREPRSAVKALSLGKILRIPGAKAVLLSFFCYCAIELTIGLWAGTYAILQYKVPSKTTALWTSLYCFGITFGRFLSGFASIRLSNKRLIRAGLVCILGGVLLLCMPLPVWKVPAGLCVAGMGCAPVYPSMLHETPEIFGRQASQEIIGVQMACAYIGSTAMPPLFGMLAGYAGISLLPFYLLAILAVLIFCRELTNRTASKAKVGAALGLPKN